MTTGNILSALARITDMLNARESGSNREEVVVPDNLRWGLVCNGAVDCSRTISFISEMFPDRDEITEWEVASLGGQVLLGSHISYVKVHVFDSPETWKTKALVERKVKCVMKCDLSLSGQFDYREFEDLFQVKNFTEADGKLIVFYDSPKMDYRRF